MHDVRHFAALPRQPQPENAGLRLILFALRQMGAHGVHDAHAAQTFMTAFGRDFRRPLTLMRAMVVELSAATTRSIQIAPWCCPRMTACEAGLVAVLGHTCRNEPAARLLLADWLGVRDPGAAFPTVAALAGAFDDLGLPLG